MSILVGLRISYVVLTLSLMAVAAQIIAALMGHSFSPTVSKTLVMAGFIWPLALYMAAIYRRRVKADEAERKA
jgi:hypothetical protein